MSPAGILLVSALAAVVVFCVVQDRTTAAGVGVYAARHREAASRGERGPAVDDVMRPAVRQSVRDGASWGFAVLAAGAGAAAVVRSASRG